MKISIVVFSVVMTFGSGLQGQSYEEEIISFQKEINEEFLNAKESPLTDKGRRKFKEHEFYPVDEKFRVEAKFVRTDNAIPFQMQTTTGRLPVYEKYGEAVFEIDGITIKLNIYQSHQLREKEEYKDYLFLPFTDLTNGKETYGGGRFIDLKMPAGDTIVIDFNKAYNPYCAYNAKFSCPIPPKENDLAIAIPAGIKKFK